jgi:hypothetical protein
MKEKASADAHLGRHKAGILKGLALPRPSGTFSPGVIRQII